MATSVLKLTWKRFVWVTFLFFYSGLFFYNFFRPFSNWFVTYIYTMILVLWLCVEYYEKHLFFQSGFLPLKQYRWYLRTMFALFFYSSFIIGCSTLVWWQSNRIHLYPILQIPGVLLLVYSIFIRRQAFRNAAPDQVSITKFYVSLFFLTISLALGYSSWFLFPYVLLIGYPLIFWQRFYELRHFRKFTEYIYEDKKIKKIDMKKYSDLWEGYINKNSKKRGKQ
jgi:hypothetical protein